ncbi:SecY-interacting protein [Aliidiomarina minuta]|uniref:Protein Syd n=1 Tax=Aliidiomarina minuta TaxID=880057 RepID=A0A432W5P5_9GAMM|nr:SecY-interacting protein [Aliidiomarina minuta]RUO25398.1 SecY-interacting protein [Aliidiomarina minuta]
MSDVVKALTKLHERYQSAYEEQDLLPQTDYMEEWSGTCYQGEVKYGLIGWKPCKQEPEFDFSAIEKGLELSLHTDVAEFYGSFYAGDLHLSYAGEDFTLLQVIHPQDADRLQRNLIGHVLMQQRLKQEVTLFVGVGTSSEDLIISVDNKTGVVGLEYVGKEQHAKLANSLAELLANATPRVVTDQ